LPIVVIRPPTGISTPEVYRRCRVPQTPKSAEGILSAMTSGDWQTFNKLVFNRLEEFAAQITPWVNKCRNDIMQSGAAGGCLCGSGSCYFGIYESDADADKAAETLKSQGWRLVVRSKLLM
jgi:4-diphosphocytidyl-2-C-methyl-D-erythritol kinase